MKPEVKGALLGAVVGVAAPVALAVGNELLFAHNNYSDITAARICFAERRWSLFKVEVKHAEGCRNGLLDSIPFCLVVGVLGGSFLGALSLVSKKTAQETPEPPAPPAVVPQAPVAVSVPEQTPDPAQTVKQDAPKPSLPAITPQVREGLEQLKGLNWNKIGKGAAVAGVVVLAYTPLNPFRTNMPLFFWVSHNFYPGGEGLVSGNFNSLMPGAPGGGTWGDAVWRAFNSPQKTSAISLDPYEQVFAGAGPFGNMNAYRACKYANNMIAYTNMSPNSYLNITSFNNHKDEYNLRRLMRELCPEVFRR